MGMRKNYVVRYLGITGRSHALVLWDVEEKNQTPARLQHIAEVTVWTTHGGYSYGYSVTVEEHVS